MTGISEIAKGDTEKAEVPIPVREMVIVLFEDLCEFDQMMMAIWEREEPPLSPLMIDPVAAKTVRPNPVG